MKVSDEWWSGQQDSNLRPPAPKSWGRREFPFISMHGDTSRICFRSLPASRVSAHVGGNPLLPRDLQSLPQPMPCYSKCQYTAPWEGTMSMTTEVFNAWSLLLQAAIGASIVGTFLVYYFMLRTMRRSAVGQNLLSLINFLQQEHVQGLLAPRFGRGSGTSPTALGRMRISATLRLCVPRTISLESLTLKQGLVPTEVITRNWGPSIRDCYNVCRDHLQAMQKGSGSEYWSNFGDLYRVLPTTSATAIGPTLDDGMDRMTTQTHQTDNRVSQEPRS